MTLDPQVLASLSPDEVAELDRLLEELEAATAYDWSLQRRPSQAMPPGDYLTWLIMAGRGFGKTRTGAEQVREWAESFPSCRIALVGRTSADVRGVMVEGESGILNVCPPWFRPRYEPSKRRLIFPNGATAYTYAAEEPDMLRGPQHHHAWCDELSAWPDAHKGDQVNTCWNNLKLGVRLPVPGGVNRIVVTTTPRPNRLTLDIHGSPSTVLTRGSTLENLSNLSPAYRELIQSYAGTRAGRQELEAELLLETDGALWTRTQLDALRTSDVPDLQKVCVAVDPAVTSGENADETGIVVAGLGADGLYYVLRDRSLKSTPNRWAQAALDAAEEFRADRVVAEANNGGDLVETVLRQIDPMVSYTKVHASRGKVTRAEPVAALYERGLVRHVLGTDLSALEDEMVTYTGDRRDASPNRLDALVWCLSWLSGKVRRPVKVW